MTNIKTRDNRVFSRVEEEAVIESTDETNEDELMIICEAQAAEVDKMFETVGRKRGAIWNLETEMRSAKRICLLNPSTPEPLEAERAQEGAIVMLNQEVVDHRRNEIEDLCRSPEQRSVHSEEQSQEVTAGDAQDPKTDVFGQYITRDHTQVQNTRTSGDTESAEPQMIQGEKATHANSDDNSRQKEQEVERTRAWLARAEETNRSDDDATVVPTLSWTMLKKLQE